MRLVNNGSADDAKEMERIGFVRQGATLSRKRDARPSRRLAVIAYFAAAIFGLVFWGIVLCLLF